MALETGNGTPISVLLFAGADDDTLHEVIASVPGIAVLRAENRDEACTALANADALISADHAWGEDMSAAIADAQRLRWIQLTTAGFDRVERCGVPARIPVSTIGDAGAAMVAEHALALLLALTRRVPDMLKAQPDGEWTFADLGKRIRSLRTLRVAVLGFGHTGRAFARLATGLGAQVTGVARKARSDAGTGCKVVALMNLYDTLAHSDAVVVTLPLNDGTAGLLDARAFDAIAAGACLVNVSRGRIVVTDALIKALESGHLAGAALDVTDPEPLPANHPLWHAPNVIISPHVAWAGGGAAQRAIIAERVAANVRRFANGDATIDPADIMYR
jgi:phosphoglycerate dehydrogenase-like enzyme